MSNAIYPALVIRRFFEGFTFVVHSFSITGETTPSPYFHIPYDFSLHKLFKREIPSTTYTLSQGRMSCLKSRWIYTTSPTAIQETESTNKESQEETKLRG